MARIARALIVRGGTYNAAHHQAAAAVAVAACARERRKEPADPSADRLAR